MATTKYSDLKVGLLSTLTLQLRPNESKQTNTTDAQGSGLLKRQLHPSANACQSNAHKVSNVLSPAATYSMHSPEKHGHHFAKQRKTKKATHPLNSPAVPAIPALTLRCKPYCGKTIRNTEQIQKQRYEGIGQCAMAQKCSEQHCSLEEHAPICHPTWFGNTWRHLQAHPYGFVQCRARGGNVWQPGMQ